MHGYSSSARLRSTTRILRIPWGVSTRLAEVLPLCWEKIPETQFETLWKSMPDRVQTVIEVKGWQTRYYPCLTGVPPGRGVAGSTSPGTLKIASKFNVKTNLNVKSADGPGLQVNSQQFYKRPTLSHPKTKLHSGSRGRGAHYDDRASHDFAQYCRAGTRIWSSI